MMPNLKIVREDLDKLYDEYYKLNNKYYKLRSKVKSLEDEINAKPVENKITVHKGCGGIVDKNVIATYARDTTVTVEYCCRKCNRCFRRVFDCYGVTDIAPGWGHPDEPERQERNVVCRVTKEYGDVFEVEEVPVSEVYPELKKKYEEEKEKLKHELEEKKRELEKVKDEMRKINKKIRCLLAEVAKAVDVKETGEDDKFIYYSDGTRIAKADETAEAYIDEYGDVASKLMEYLDYSHVFTILTDVNLKNMACGGDEE